MPADRNAQTSLTAKLAELADVDELELAPEIDEPEPARRSPSPRSSCRPIGASSPRAPSRPPSPRLRGTTHVTGVAGGAAALWSAPSRSGRSRRIVAMTADIEAARALAADVSFLLGERDADDAEAAGAGDASARSCSSCPTRRAPTPTSTPTARGARDAARHALPPRGGAAVDASWCARSPRSRARSCPRDEVLEHAELVVVEQEIDRDKLTARLAQMGYVRSPLVRGSGHLRRARRAARRLGALGAEAPVRIELYGDLVLGIKSFDPESQRTLRELREVWISPAREAILTPANVERARERVRAACDAVDCPRPRRARWSTTWPRGARSSGPRGSSPRTSTSRRSPSTCPADAVFAARGSRGDHRGAARRAGPRGRGRGAEGHGAALPPRRFYEPEGARRRRCLGDRAVVALHRTGIEGESAEPGLAGALRGGARGHGLARRRRTSPISSGPSRRRARRTARRARSIRWCGGCAPGRRRASASSSPRARRRRSSG